MQRYNPSAIEPKWQELWASEHRYNVVEDSAKQKFYISCMFPYPSGAGMHTGHAFEHAIVDSVARFHRQLGHNVLNPMGWDAFGLPAENYAIKTGTAPSEVTKINIANFKNQLNRMGASLDWSRELNTSDPEYYRWTQWIFAEFFKRGLAYQKESMQWWCPVDKTVLANEQVINGRCWRCENEVEKKSMKQWFLKITQYADALLEELPALDWPGKIKTAQENWIGKSEGAEVQFDVDVAAKDSLKFTPELTKMILSGEKTSTVRLEAKQVKEGEYVDFFTRDGEKVQQFGKAKIIRERSISLRDIPNDLAGHEEFSSEDEKLKTYQGYYGDTVSLDTQFVIYDFEFMPRITVFTTRVDTIFGATFLVLAPEHTLVAKLTDSDTKEVVERYVKEAVKKSEIERMSEGKEKTGVPTGSYAINPATGEKVPIWVADYVLAGYGTGAVMGVPGHDERDYEFAEKLKLPIIEVIEKPENSTEQCYHGEGKLINSGDFDGKMSSDAREEIVDWLEQQGVGEAKTTYKMRDWLLSRQRYWGAPIPIIHCEKDGAVAVPENQLPVLLPPVKDFEPKGDGKSVLARETDWVNTTCPTCGGPAQRETDTMDGYACSSWYLMRYTDAHNDNAAWAPEKGNYWAPLDMYVGGDHAVAHLLYVRFWHHVFNEMGLTNFKEPVKKLVYHGYINAEDGTKMSKSKGNVVDPLEVIDQGYGADALRVFLLFLGPIDLNANWSSTGIGGVYRFLNRVWTLAQEYQDADTSGESSAHASEIRTATHRTIKKVTTDYHKLSFNTAVAALMEYTNELYKWKVDGFGGDAWNDAFDALVRLIGPMAPHMGAELWQQLGNESKLEDAGWPSWDDALLVTDTMTIMVQVNGKVRAKLSVAKDIGEEDIKTAALRDGNVQKFVGEASPSKVIYIAGRLVSIVV